jgi:hypothetical protein
VERHPYFDLWLHTDVELAHVLGSPLLGRETLHEWPLSCVQRLELQDGRSLIYKAQFAEGVETAFYAAARSPLLPWHQDLGEHGSTRHLLLECIQAPLLAELRLDEALGREHARCLDIALGKLDAGLPVYQDIGTRERWQAYQADALGKLEGLVRDGIFSEVSPAQLSGLRQWANSTSIQALFEHPARLAHADLSPENVFVTPEGYKLIDWQYPRRLPPGFDVAGLLLHLGLDPLPHVQPGLVQLVWFVRLAWFVECKLRLFPPGETYGREVRDLADQILA